MVTCSTEVLGGREETIGWSPGDSVGFVVNFGIYFLYLDVAVKGVLVVRSETGGFVTADEFNVSFCFRNFFIKQNDRRLLDLVVLDIQLIKKLN